MVTKVGVFFVIYLWPGKALKLDGVGREATPLIFENHNLLTPNF